MRREEREGRKARADLEDRFRFSRVKNELLNDGEGEGEELSSVEISDGWGGHADEKAGVDWRKKEVMEVGKEPSID